MDRRGRRQAGNLGKRQRFRTPGVVESGWRPGRLAGQLGDPLPDLRDARLQLGVGVLPQPAGDGAAPLASALAAIEVAPPAVPIISNVDAAVSTDGVHFNREGTAFSYDGLVDPDVFWTGQQWVMHVFSLSAGATRMPSGETYSLRPPADICQAWASGKRTFR